jgi:hypothetical protein
LKRRGWKKSKKKINSEASGAAKHAPLPFASLHQNTLALLFPQRQRCSIDAVPEGIPDQSIDLHIICQSDPYVPIRDEFKYHP